MTDRSPNPEDAHPGARALMTEAFYFSPVEESGPFGSDDGWDTFQGFLGWRSLHPSDDPLAFLEEHFAFWGYPPFDLHETDPEIILDYCHQHESGSTFLVGMDAAIIAVAFGQLYLEGIIHPALRALAVISIRRQLSFYLLLLWDEDYRSVREEQLSHMLSILERTGEPV